MYLAEKNKNLTQQLSQQQAELDAMSADDHKQTHLLNILVTDLEKKNKRLSVAETTLETTKQLLEATQQTLEETRAQDCSNRNQQDKLYQKLKKEHETLKCENAQLRREISDVNTKLATIQSHASLTPEREGESAATESQQEAANEPTGAAPSSVQEMYTQLMAK